MAWPSSARAFRAWWSEPGSAAHSSWASAIASLFSPAIPVHSVGYAQRVVYLADHQVCVLTTEDWKVLDTESQQVSAQVHNLDWEPADTDKGDFEHFMLKEIYEQPEVLGTRACGPV